MKCLLPFFLMMFFYSSAHSEVYRCVSDSGQTVYKDTECKDGEILKSQFSDESLQNTANVSQAYVSSTSALKKNLLVNASFEYDLKNWTVPYGGQWTVNLGINRSGGLLIQTTIAPEDEFIHETKIEQCVLIGNGEKFELKAQFKADKLFAEKYSENASVANRVTVTWYESEDCTVGGQFGWFVDPKNIQGWQSLKYSDLIPAFKAVAAKISIVQDERYAQGNKAYWDDISFSITELSKADNKKQRTHKVVVNKNYVVNGGFKLNLVDWHSWGAVWVAEGNADTGSAKVTLESEKGGLGLGVLDQCINVNEKYIYNFGASIKKTEKSIQDSGGRIRVSWFEKSDCYGSSKIGSKHADIMDLAGWQSLQVNNMAPPQGSHSVSLSLIQSIPGPGKSSVLWDNVYFMAIEEIEFIE